MPRKTEGAGSHQPAARDAASMRPRPDAAENVRCAQRAADGTGSFNEAAARCRGKQKYARLAAFEAALASMRPRPDAAENSRACVSSLHPELLLQ